MAIGQAETSVASKGACPFTDEEYVASLRKQMVQFAMLQLKDTTLAEDVTQEALLGAYKNAQQFSNRAAFKTWVFAILKNKIVDALRKEHRSIAVSQLVEQGEEIDSCFDNKGHWVTHEKPKSWHIPEEDLQQAHFWKTLEVCLNAMSERYAKIFMMRDFIGLETEEICQLEEMNTNQFHVTLYRARLKLRACLEKGWFSEGVHSS